MYTPIYICSERVSYVKGYKGLIYGLNMFLKSSDVQVLIVSDTSMPHAFRRGAGNGRPEIKFEEMKKKKRLEMS